MTTLENCCNATMPPSGYSQGSDLAGAKGTEPQWIQQDTTDNIGWISNRCMHRTGLVYCRILISERWREFKEWAMDLFFLSFSSFAVLPKRLWILNELYRWYVWLHVSCEEQFSSLWCPKVFLWEPWGAGLEKAGGFHPPSSLPIPRSELHLGRASRASHKLPKYKPKAKNLYWGNSKYFSNSFWIIFKREVMPLFLEQTAVLSCFRNTWRSGKEQKLAWEHKVKENQDKHKTT